MGVCVLIRPQGTVSVVAATVMGSLSAYQRSKEGCMLTTTTRLKLQEILGRVARSEPVSLQERVLLQKYADRDRTVSSWVHRAERLRQRGCAAPGLDGLLDDLDLGRNDAGDRHRPGDDLGDWFGGASSWLRRD